MERKIRKIRKTRKIKKQKGRGYSKEEREKILNKAQILVNTLTNFKRNPLKTLDENDGVYNKFKKTILKAGTILTFRSNEPVLIIKDKPMWLDYSPIIKKQSFLKAVEDESDLPAEIPMIMADTFGPWINTVKVVKPITILHFPVNYESIEKSQNKDSYSAFFEGVVNATCAKKKWKAENFTEPCADGYTLDFFFKSMKGKFMAKGWYIGYREICIYHPHESLEIIDHTYDPFPYPFPYPVKD